MNRHESAKPESSAPEVEDYRTDRSTLAVSMGRIADTTVTLEEYQAGARPVVAYEPSEKRRPRRGEVLEDSGPAHTVDPDDPRLLSNRSHEYWGKGQPIN